MLQVGVHTATSEFVAIDHGKDLSGRADAIFWMRTHETVAEGVSEPAASEAGEGVTLTDA